MCLYVEWICEYHSMLFRVYWAYYNLSPISSIIIINPWYLRISIRRYQYKLLHASVQKKHVKKWMRLWYLPRTISSIIETIAPSLEPQGAQRFTLEFPHDSVTATIRKFRKFAAFIKLPRFHRYVRVALRLVLSNLLRDGCASSLSLAPMTSVSQVYVYRYT